MSQTDIEVLRYPVGKFNFTENPSANEVSSWIATLEEFPIKLLQLASSIEEHQLEWCYRPEGWNIRQIIHHLADSHMNSFIRFRWTLTEDEPIIKAYDEKQWAGLPDSLEAPVAPSLALLDGLHERWAFLMRSLSEDDLKKVFVHPETKRKIRLDQNVGLYAWHCEHHYAHILLALEHEGKYKN